MILDLPHTLEITYKTALFFCNTEFLMAFIIFGLFFWNREAFLNTILISILTIFIGQYLKSVWQIPLNPELGKEGWAFPSGHTILNIVFWPILCIQLRSSMLIAFAVIVVPLSFLGMVHFRYHTWQDIMGGVIFGLPIIIVGYLWLRERAGHTMELLITSMLVSGLCYWKLYEFEHYIWMAFYWGIYLSLIFLYISEWLFKRQLITQEASKLNLMLFIICIASGIVVKFIGIPRDIYGTFIEGALVLTPCLVISFIWRNIIVRKKS